MLYIYRQLGVNRHTSRVIAIGIDKRTIRNSRNDLLTSVSFSSSRKTIQLEQLLLLNLVLAVIKAQIQSLEVPIQNNKLFLINRNITIQFVLKQDIQLFNAGTIAFYYDYESYIDADPLLAVGIYSFFVRRIITATTVRLV